MKFHAFVQPQYPGLPADFRHRYRSAWVDPPTSLLDPHEVGRLYRKCIRLLEEADRVGFDGVVINEHHQSPFALTPSPNLVGATLAANTRNVAIVLLGNSIALYNPPVRVAEELAYLDCLSDGRVVAGFVIGIPMDSLFSYGIPPVELRERFHEARELILRSWREPEPFAFNGKYTKLRYVNVHPRPLQSPPPVWVPGVGSLETWGLVIDEGYCYSYLSGGGGLMAKPVVKTFWERVEERGGDLNPHRLALAQTCCVAESDAEAERLYAESVKRFYSQNAINPLHFAAPGYTSTRSLRSQIARAGAVGGAADRERALSGEMDFWEYDEKGYIVAGTPDRVAARLRDLATELRLGHFIVNTSVGNLPEEVGMLNTRLIGTEVAPALRDLWDDWPDHWTPAAAQSRHEAAASATAGS